MSSFLAAGRAAPRVAPNFIKKGAKRKGKNQKTTKFEAFFDPGIIGSLNVTYFGGDETMEHAFLNLKEFTSKKVHCLGW